VVRFIVSRLAILLCRLVLLTTPGFAQTPDLNKFVPGAWKTPSGHITLKITRMEGNMVIGEGAADARPFRYDTRWVQHAVGTGHFENGVLHLTLPDGSEVVVTLHPDGRMVGTLRGLGHSDDEGVQPLVFNRQ
jgi:hypothetical protein